MDRLFRLCGLDPDELAEALENNPRAYMAVKGAVAEVHLHKYLIEQGNLGHIVGLKSAQGDFDKDFYIQLPDGREFAIECKNIEVLKTNQNKTSCIEYLRYLQLKEDIFEGQDFSNISDYTLADLKVLHSDLPQSFRESGIPRYEYSASKIEEKSLAGGLSDSDFLAQFDNSPLSIDFQRTRNSNNKKGVNADPKTNRFYTLDEVDIVAACLFSRTMKWEFVFGSKSSLIIHPKYKGLYSNRLVLDSKKWHSNLMDVV